MISLDEQEAYCIALIIVNGGQMEYKALRDIVFEFRESFHGLAERYIKYKAVKRVLSNLVSQGFLLKSKDAYSVDSDLEEYLVKKHANFLVKAIKNLAAFRKQQKQHILEFDLSFTQETILSEEWEDVMPYGLIEELKGAIDIHQKTEEHDAVLTKCGRCIEIMVEELNRQYSLFSPRKSITRIISEIKNEEVIQHFSSDPEERETFRVFAYAVYTIYKFRNKMGAHRDWRWGSEEVATSCLILTLYIADLYSTDIRKSEEEE